MSKSLKPRRGTTAEHADFIGQAHEVTYDTDKHTLVTHDGVTPGGFPLLRADQQAAKDAAQDEAIAEAQSSAEAASKDVTALDTALRQLIAEELAKYLRLTGGHLTGNLCFDQVDALIHKGDNTGRLVVRGGLSGFNTGASMYLHGAENANAGQFRFYAHDGTQDKAFLGYPDGRLLWGGNRLMTMPDYNAGVSFTLSTTGYTAPSDGYIMGNFNANGEGGYSLTINGKSVGADNNNNQGICYPVSKGDVVKVTAGTYSHGNYFFPIKGA